MKLNFGQNYINEPEVAEKFKAMRNNLEYEKAEQYVEELRRSEREWCHYYYSNGNCARSSKSSNLALGAQLERLKECSSAAKTCTKEDLSKQEGEVCVNEMEKHCWFSSANETGHPFPHNLLLNNAKKRLPSLNFSNQGLPAEVADAYNKCEAGQKWGYHITDKPIDSKILFYARTGKSKTIGSFSSQRECDEARLKSDPDLRRGLEIDRCTKRYVGPQVNSRLYKANLMYKSEGHGGILPSVKKDSVTFYTQEACQKAVSSGNKYKFYYGEYAFEEVQVSPLSSDSENKFISECKREEFTVCTENISGYSKIDAQN